WKLETYYVLHPSPTVATVVPRNTSYVGVEMAASRPFGSRPPGAVAIVEPSLSQLYARKARVVFFFVWAAVGGLSAVLLAALWHPVLAALAGALLGLVVGFDTSEGSGHGARAGS